MTGDAEPIFIDTNVLVYATQQRAPLHDLALRALKECPAAGGAIWISRQILREYLATMSRPQLFSNPLRPEELIADVERFQQQFNVADDDPTVTMQLLQLIGRIPVGGRQIHDANIVATMLGNGIGQLLTHNIEDFER